MMRGYKCGLLLIAMSCWVPVAVAADSAAGAGAAPVAKKAIPSPEEDYRAAKQAEKDDDLMEKGALLRRAADRGHAQAQAEVCDMLGYATAWEKALEYCRKSAEQDNADGQLALGLIYANGSPAAKKDFVEARKWITLSAEQGNRYAIIMLADSYIDGGLGLSAKERDGSDALRWIKRGADVNHPTAVKALLSAYQTGKYGLTADPGQIKALQAQSNRLFGIKVEEKKSKKSR